MTSTEKNLYNYCLLRRDRSVDYRPVLCVPRKTTGRRSVMTTADGMLMLLMMRDRYVHTAEVHTNYVRACVRTEQSRKRYTRRMTGGGHNGEMVFFLFFCKRYVFVMTAITSRRRRSSCINYYVTAAAATPRVPSGLVL